MTSFGVLLSIIVVAITFGVLAEEFSYASQSLLSYPNGQFSPFIPLGHVEDIRLVKEVSPMGVIEIDKITFTVVNDDQSARLFQVCAIIEGPYGMYSPSINNEPACTITKLIEGNDKLENQSIDFLNAINVSDIVGISISIEEL